MESAAVTPKLVPSTSHDYFSFRTRQESVKSGPLPTTTTHQGWRNRKASESYNSRTEFMAQLPFAADPTPTPFGTSITSYNGATESYVASLEAARNTAAFKLSVPHRLPTNTAPMTQPNDEGFLSMLPFISHSWGSTTSGAVPLPETPQGDLPLQHMSINVGRDGHVMNSEISIEMTNMDAFDGDRLFQHHVPLLDPSKSAQMNAFRIFYADMLYRLGLFEKRAEVLKFVVPAYQEGEEGSKSKGRKLSGGNDPTTSNSSHQITNYMQTLLGTNGSHLDIKVRCRQCHQELADEASQSSDGANDYCSTCRRTRHHISCCICHTLVRGLVNFCIHCGHGGHSKHIKEWFVDMQRDVCPTGCGCRCLYETLEYGLPELSHSLTPEKAR